MSSSKVSKNLTLPFWEIPDQEDVDEARANGDIVLEDFQEFSVISNNLPESSGTQNSSQGSSSVVPRKTAEPITDQRKQDAEQEIQENMKIVDYDTREFPVEVLVYKYTEGIQDDENELFVPDYQRELAWDQKRQSKFIESILIGLPIPYIFVADIGKGQLTDISSGGVFDSRLEIIDGSQRIRTLARFINNELKLVGLQKLKKLNEFKFSDLPLARQRRFKRHTIRMIELTEKADENVRRDMFERINTGSVDLTDMEKRRGIKDGPFVKFIEDCAKNTLFQELAPISEAASARREREEFVLRFFAYLNEKERFVREVNKFLDSYLDETQMAFDSDCETKFREEFINMLNFVKLYFPFGFKKGPRTVTTPRIRFESISVGVALALREKPGLVPNPQSILEWLQSPEFKSYTTSDASNSRPKLLRRINYVKEKILKG